MYPVSEDGGCRKKWKRGYWSSTFDGDGISDTSKLRRWVEKNDESSATGETITVFEEASADEAELQGVWLSSNGNIDPKQPDLTRLMDWSADFEDRALLSQISTDDLQNTDIYVFRESNGQLVAERRGLTDNEYLNGVNDSEGKFFFTLHMVGRYGDLYGRGEKELEQWQAKGWAKLLKNLGHSKPNIAKGAQHHFLLLVEESLKPDGRKVKALEVTMETGLSDNRVLDIEWEDGFTEAKAYKDSLAVGNAVSTSKKKSNGEIDEDFAGQMLRDISNFNPREGFKIEWVFSPEGLADLKKETLIKRADDIADKMVGLIKKDAKAMRVLRNRFGFADNPGLLRFLNKDVLPALKGSVTGQKHDQELINPSTFII